ncbi:MAG: hypothetical protein ABIR32_22865 [Ilumatobacteraceae bacterium]
MTRSLLREPLHDAVIDAHPSTVHPEMVITALGWLGTLLVLVSYTQPNVTRLRQISLAASVVLITFNLLLGIWSNCALEVALVGINVQQLKRSRVPAH